MNENIFYDIPTLVSEQENISADNHPEKWRIVDYESNGINGRLLWANENSKPKPVTLNVSLEGVYHIYVATIKLQTAYKHRETLTGFKLSSEETKPQVRTMHPPATLRVWKPTEWIEESYYTTADLTGEKFILFKPDLEFTISALAWIRLVPTEKEAAEREPCMAYHFDKDYLEFDKYSAPREAFGILRMVSDGAPKLVLHEKFPVYDLSCVDLEDPRGHRGEKFYLNNHDEMDALLIDEAHKLGSKIYASFRMEAGGFSFPDDRMNYLFCDKWFEDHPEYRCITRDGRVVDTSSFAYPEVRRRVIEMIVKNSEGFDGVDLFYHRGTFVAFEEPIKKMVWERYGIDASRLPMSDPRLHTVFAHFMTLFMRELREALDTMEGKRMGVNVFLFHDPKNSLYFGYNAEEWINEGLIDSICQGLMTHYEVLDGVLDEDGLVDIEKYKKALCERVIIDRDYSPDYQLVTEGAKEFMRICGDKVDFYATLAWEGSTVEDTLSLTDGLKALGVKNFVSWNTDHKTHILPLLNAEKFYSGGNPELYEERKTKYYRVLSLGGNDTSHYNPSWKG